MGDVFVVGVDCCEDFVFVCDCYDFIDVFVYFFLGNYDMGEIFDDGKKGLLVIKEGFNCFKEVFLLDCWMIEIENWILIGLNLQLININFSEEGE